MIAEAQQQMHQLHGLHKKLLNEPGREHDGSEANDGERGMCTVRKLR